MLSEANQRFAMLQLGRRIKLFYFATVIAFCLTHLLPALHCMLWRCVPDIFASYAKISSSEVEISTIHEDALRSLA